MQNMVITIESTGAFHHTLKDSFFDTRGMGKREIERVSEVLFDDNAQAFYIKWLRGPRTGYTECDGNGTLKLFDTYEQAVEYEINTLNAWRMDGILLTA